jgi:small subunit ribosomal protein S6
MRLYETGFLISPNVSEEDADVLIQQMADVVSQKNGKMVKLEKWGKRRMAYQIGKYGEAYYVFFHYDGGPDIPLELGRRFRQMDTILRHLTLMKETQQNVRKRKKMAGRGRTKDAVEESADATAGKESVVTPETKKREEA